MQKEDAKKLQLQIDLQEEEGHCKKLCAAMRWQRKIIAVLLLAGILGLALFASRAMAGREKAEVQISDIVTSAQRVYGEEVFRGCPHATYRVQGPTPMIAVDPIWSDTLESIRVELDKNAFQRSHIAKN
jgi:hypothetical protein